MQVVPTEVDTVQTEGNKQVDVRTTEGQAKYNRLIPTYIGVPPTAVCSHTALRINGAKVVP